MFTGIVDHCGRLVAVEPMQQGVRFTLTTDFTDLVLGESIAVDGVCLTVSDLQAGVFCCDVSPETLALTTFGSYTPNTHVNLERSLAVGERMGGHYVTGHVDCTATIAACQPHQHYLELQLAGFTRAQAAYLIPKGSVSVNGVSLTINSITPNRTISLMLIPHTLMRTNLRELSSGQSVNIEFDYYAKVIAHQLAMQQEVKHVL